MEKVILKEGNKKRGASEVLEEGNLKERGPERMVLKEGNLKRGAPKMWT